MDELFEELGPEQLSVIDYHTSGPYSIPEAITRAGYYGVTGVPDTYFDGIDHVVGGWSGTYDAYLNIVENHLEDPSPMTIEIEGIITPTNGVMNAQLTLSENIAESGVFAYGIVYENGLSASGHTFNFLARQFLPAQELEIYQAGQSQEITFEFDLDEEADETQTGFVFFVQNQLTKEVYQSYHFVPGASEYGMVYSALETMMAKPFGEPADFISTYENTGMQEDTYIIELETDAPEEWTSFYLTNDEVYIEGDLAQVTLQAGEQMDLLLEVMPQVMAGEGYFSITITSLAEPLITRTITYKVIAGYNILLVDDGSGEYETYYQMALDANGYEYATWDVAVGGELDQSEINLFDAIIWFTGDASTDNTLSVDEQNKLMEYLDNGGRLFLTGQNIGQDIEGDTDFYSNYVCADFVIPSAPQANVLGVAGDPISEGLDLWINGGAGNQSSADAIHGIEPAIIIYDYNGFPFEAGLRVEKTTGENPYRLVYLAFGFEGISGDWERKELMYRILTWLGQETYIFDENMPNTPLFSLEQNYPNPFNPQTTIRFALPQKSQVSLNIYDITGQLIRNLISEKKEAGAYSVIWDGKDDNAKSVASGLYLYQINTEGYSKIRQCLLLK